MHDLGPPIASFIERDVKALLCRFFSQKNLAYVQFKRTWHRMSMSHLHHVIPSGVDIDAFYQLSFDLILRMLHVVDPCVQDISQHYNCVDHEISGRTPRRPRSEPKASKPSSSFSLTVDSGDLEISHLHNLSDLEGRTIVWNIGVVYMLYTLYATQIQSNKSLINISPEYYSSLRLAAEQIVWLGEIGNSAVQIFNLMVKEELLVFGLCTGPVTPWGVQRWEKLMPFTLTQLSKAIKLHRPLSEAIALSGPTNFIEHLKDIFGDSFEESEERIILMESTEPNSDDEKDSAEGSSAADSAALRPSPEDASYANEKSEKGATKKKKASLNVRAAISTVMGMRSGMRLSSSSGAKPTLVTTTAASEVTLSRTKETSVDENGSTDGGEGDYVEEIYTDDSDSSDEGKRSGRAEYVSSQELKRRRLGEHYKRLDQNEL